MFNRKHDRIQDLEWEVQYQRDRATGINKDWQVRNDRQFDRQNELHEQLEERRDEIKVLEADARGYVTTWEVSNVLYTDRDEDGLRKEADRITRTFDNETDALHYATDQRLDSDEENESILIHKMETRRTSLNKEGQPFGRLFESALYGSPFFIGA